MTSHVAQGLPRASQRFRIWMWKLTLKRREHMLYEHHTRALSTTTPFFDYVNWVFMTARIDHVQHRLGTHLCNVKTQRTCATRKHNLINAQFDKNAMLRSNICTAVSVTLYTIFCPIVGEWDIFIPCDYINIKVDIQYYNVTGFDWNEKCFWENEWVHRLHQNQCSVFDILLMLPWNGQKLNAVNHFVCRSGNPDALVYGGYYCSLTDESSVCGHCLISILIQGWF